MSQLAKAIQAVDTGERVLIRTGMSPLFNDLVKVSSESMTDPFVGLRYRIGCRIEASCVITDTETRSYNDTVQVSVDRVKQQVIEAVFGEFRQDIMRIHLALNNYDVETARILLLTLENNMYEI